VKKLKLNNFKMKQMLGREENSKQQKPTYRSKKNIKVSK
jgi:hypothetical protein